jgi:hypothetical protein
VLIRCTREPGHDDRNDDPLAETRAKRPAAAAILFAQEEARRMAKTSTATKQTETAASSRTTGHVVRRDERHRSFSSEPPASSSNIPAAPLTRRRTGRSFAAATRVPRSFHSAGRGMLIRAREEVAT